MYPLTPYGKNTGGHFLWHRADGLTEVQRRVEKSRSTDGGLVDEFVHGVQLDLGEDGVLLVGHVAHSLQEDGGVVDVLLEGGQGLGALLSLKHAQVHVLHQLLQLFQLLNVHLHKTQSKK